MFVPFHRGSLSCGGDLSFRAVHLPCLVGRAIALGMPRQVRPSSSSTTVCVLYLGLRSPFWYYLSILRQGFSSSLLRLPPSAAISIAPLPIRFVLMCLVSRTPVWRVAPDSLLRSRAAGSGFCSCWSHPSLPQLVIAGSRLALLLALGALPSASGSSAMIRFTGRQRASSTGPPQISWSSASGQCSSCCYCYLTLARS